MRAGQLKDRFHIPGAVGDGIMALVAGEIFPRAFLGFKSTSSWQRLRRPTGAQYGLVAEASKSVGTTLHPRPDAERQEGE